MNLLCPSCQKMLQVPEQYAGQQMRCPLCTNVFTVPGMPAGPAPAAAPPPPPPPPAGPYTLTDDPAAAPPPAPPDFAPPPLPATAPAPRQTTPAPPIHERDYTRLKTLWISKRVVPWIAPIALGVWFLLSFFPLTGNGPNVWSAAFGTLGEALFIFYVLFTLFGLLAAVGSLLIHLRVIPQLPPIEKFRPLIVGGFVWLAFVLLFFWLLIKTFSPGILPFGFWGLLLFWTHFVAAVGLLLELWLQLRGPEAPSPRIDLHL